MTKRMIRAATVVAALASGGLVTPRASADLVVTLSIQEASGTNLVGSFSGTDMASNLYKTLSDGTTTFSMIQITASSNTPGDASGNLAQQSVDMKGSSGPGTLVIDVQETSSFTNPGAPGTLMDLTSSVSRSSGTTPLTFQSYVTTGSPGTTTTTGLQTFDPSVPSWQSPNMVSTTFVRGDSYFLHNVMTIGAGGTLNVNATETVTAITPTETVTATPEPPTLAAVVAGLPVLAIGAWGRSFRARRRA